MPLVLQRQRWIHGIFRGATDRRTSPAHSSSNVMEAGPEYRSDEVDVWHPDYGRVRAFTANLPDSDDRVVWRVPASQAQALLRS